MSSKISVDQLRQIFTALIDHVEEQTGPEVIINEDYFWSIPSPDLYEVYVKPETLTIGQLSECITNLESLAKDPEFIISYGLVWLAELLRAIGIEAVG